MRKAKAGALETSNVNARAAPFKMHHKSRKCLENEEKIEKDTKETEKKMEETKVSNRYEALVKASKTVHHKDGDEEDDEDDDEDEEEDCDWEWDYGDGEEDNDKEEKAEEVISDYIGKHFLYVF